jgi:glycosyltransferase involved in cell wall biosynthesis
MQPLLSVWMCAYNHEKYIAQAIDSVLMQKTDFDFDIIIGEDCSSDNTRQIVLSYQQQYPDKIKLFLPNQNLGMNAILVPTFKLCTGRYIAMLDGDDYWTDPFKLQKQVDILESNPNLVFVCHRVLVSNSILKVDYESYAPAFVNNDDLLTNESFHNFHGDIPRLHNPVYTLSVVFRNLFEGELPTWIANLPYPDLGIYFVLMLNGAKAKYLHDNLGVYRVHDKGSYSGMDTYTMMTSTVTYFETLLPLYGGEFVDKVKKLMGFYLYALMVEDLKHGRFNLVRSRIKNLLKYDLAVVEKYNSRRLHRFSAYLMRTVFQRP